MEINDDSEFKTPALDLGSGTPSCIVLSTFGCYKSPSPPLARHFQSVSCTDSCSLQFITMKTFAFLAIAVAALLVVAINAQSECELCNTNCAASGKVFKKSNPCLDYCGTASCPENCDTDTYCGCFCEDGYLDAGNGTCVPQETCCENVSSDITLCSV